MTDTELQRALERIGAIPGSGRSVTAAAIFLAGEEIVRALNSVEFRLEEIGDILADVKKNMEEP